MDLEQEFTNETGRCPDNDVQYYADWLEEKVKKLTTDNNDYAKCEHIIGLICGTLNLAVADCNELNLHNIYHKVVGIKNVSKELNQHFA